MILNEAPKIEFLNMDNMEFMKSVPDKFYDLAIVDPPYGIKASSGASTNGTMRKKIANGEIKGGNWDDSIPNDEYFKELFRVSKNQIIWGGNYFDLPPSKCFLIWDKGESIYGRDFAECEMAWASFDKCARIYKLFPNQKDRTHPTQKPIKLYKWLLTKYAKPNDKILDTHGGSFSSAIACYELGFDFTGIELDKEYFDNAVNRFNTHKSQLKLF
jgi:site-specific DNA-methyltransferase (adenine-specific)